MLTIEDIFEEKNIEESINDLLGKRDSCGYDGIRISQFREFWGINKSEITNQILENKFEPGIVQNQEIVYYGGKRRTISKLTCTDRVILRAIKQKLEVEYDTIFSDNSFAYQKNKGINAAVERIAAFANTGAKWVLECDIKNFFDNIPFDRLLGILSGKIEDTRVVALIEKYLHCKVEHDFAKITTKQKGIVQGSPLSPLLSNIFLNEIDKQLETDGIEYCRFADDIKLFFTEREQANAYVTVVKRYLEDLGLELNQDKTGAYPILSRGYFGFELYQNGETVFSRRRQKKAFKSYTYWRKEAIQKIGQNYHIINDGILSKRDFTILFEGEDDKRYLPVETVDTIGIHSNVIFSAQFFELMDQKKISVALFNKYGTCVGRFVNNSGNRSAKILLRQVSVYNDEKKRLELARTILLAAMHNIRSNLKYYKKHSDSRYIEDSVHMISEKMKEINEAGKIEELLMLEARARQRYYQTFSEILEGSDFDFTSRTKRPPKDPINALISFGNVVLYNRIAREIYKTSMDIRIGILHSTNNRSESLNLDIAEIFKPIIVDRVIFSLVNKKMIDSKLHFEKSKDGNGIYLTKEGKRIFITELEDKLYQKIKVKERRVYYHTLIREEVGKLLRMYTYGEKYVPYKYY